MARKPAIRSRTRLDTTERRDQNVLAQVVLGFLTMALNPLYKIGEVPAVVTGTHEKPDYCRNNCPRAYSAPGFVADHVPDNPKIAFLFNKPSKDCVTQCRALAGGLGRFFWAAVARGTGLTKDDIILSHVLRCYSWKYPVGKDARSSEIACRYWDRFHNIAGHPHEGGELTSLAGWKPNLFLITFGLEDMVEMGAYHALGLADVKKAVSFVDKGFRPVVLMGREAMSLLVPWLTGGVKKWRGHWWEGEWRIPPQPEEKAKGFAAASYKGIVRNRRKGGATKNSRISQGELFT